MNINVGYKFNIDFSTTIIIRIINVELLIQMFGLLAFNIEEIELIRASRHTKLQLVTP